MGLKYKFSISVIIIFLINTLLLLSFYQLYLKPQMTDLVNNLQNNFSASTHEIITSQEEAGILVEDFNYRTQNWKQIISGNIIRNLLIFEIGVILLILILVIIVSYQHHIKPLELLIQSMDDYSRGKLPEEVKTRKDEIGKLQSRFYRLANSVESEKQKQTQIIASISHDIKTPLTAVMGYSERLQKIDYPEEKKRKYLSTIYSKAESINEIINEFDEYLSYNFESSLILESRSITYICSYITKEYAEELSDTGVKFIIENNCSENEEMILDLLKFKRVIGNLISNSIKHKSEEPRLKLQVHRDESSVVFVFEDNGKGVLDENLSYIFDPLYTSDTTRKVAGLGLSICKNIVNAHGGVISAENLSSGGLAVKMQFPALRE